MRDPPPVFLTKKARRRRSSPYNGKKGERHMRRTLGLSSAFGVALFIALAGATAAKADVTYNYQGSNFTSIILDFVLPLIYRPLVDI